MTEMQQPAPLPPYLQYRPSEPTIQLLQQVQGTVQELQRHLSTSTRPHLNHVANNYLVPLFEGLTALVAMQSDSIVHYVQSLAAFQHDAENMAGVMVGIDVEVAEELFEMLDVIEDPKRKAEERQQACKDLRAAIEALVLSEEDVAEEDGDGMIDLGEEDA